MVSVSLISYSNLLHRQFDAASCHAIPASIVSTLRSEGIYWQVLERSTTGFSQCLDTGGLFRSLKAAIRAGGHVGTPGAATVFRNHHGPISTVVEFWAMLKNLISQYSNLAQFGNLGFSWRQSDFRKNGVDLKSRGLNSRVLKLYEEAMVEDEQEMGEV